MSIWLASGSRRVLRGGGWSDVPQRAGRRPQQLRPWHPRLHPRRSAHAEVHMSIWLASGPRHVIRGGGCYVIPQNARVANRYDNYPGNRSNRLGVRLLRRVS